MEHSRQKPMKHRYISHGTLLICMFGFCQVALAEDKRIYVPDYDFDGNGVISRGKEFDAFVLAVNPISSSDLDANRDGYISNSEHESYGNLRRKKVEAVMDDLGDKEKYSFVELAAYGPNIFPLPRDIVPEDNGDEERDTWDWYLRGSKEDLGILDTPLPNARAAPALFSFARNYEDASSTWQAVGALMGRKRIRHYQDAASDGGLSAVYLIPSLTFNKLDTNGDPAKEADSLVFRLGGEAVFLGENKAAFVRANPTLGTDTNFRSLLGGFEVQVEPVFNNTIIGSAQSHFDGKLQYRLRPLLNLETGLVFDAGRKANLQNHEDDWFTRVGPQLHLDMWSDVPWLERFSLTMSYSHYEALGNGLESGGFFDSSLSIRLDDDGNISLTTKYQHGEVPFIKDSVDILSVGLGFKF